MNDSTFHSKFRPKTLDKVIGHEQAVATLKGMLENPPGAILICGPTSVGKTTLARAFAQGILDCDPTLSTDYKETDAGVERTIDDIREIIRWSKFSPIGNRRIIVIDEAQSLMSNKIAASALLKVLEEAGKTKTVWILCSMEPDKFNSSTGKAIANRCTKFILNPPNDSELTKQARRIRKMAEMDYVSDEQIKFVVDGSGGEMRNVANLMQQIFAYVKNTGDKKIKELPSLLKLASHSDDELVVEVFKAWSNKDYAKVHRALMDVTEGFQFVNKLVWSSQFLMNQAASGGRHQKVWYTDLNKKISAALKGQKLRVTAQMYHDCVQIKSRASRFEIPEMDLISTSIFKSIESMP